MPCTTTRSPLRAPELRSALYTVTPAHMKGPASSGGNSSGIDATADAGATIYSAYPPSKSMPVILRLMHIAKSHHLHCSQTKSSPPCQPTPRRLHFFYSVPTSPT